MAGDTWTSATGNGGFDEGRGSAWWRHVRLGGSVVAICAMAWQAGHLRFNLSPCVPRGVYYLHAGATALPGELVLACPPARAAELALRRHYLLPGSCAGGTKPIGKLVAAVAGDILDLELGGITVNGQALSSTVALAFDSEGRPLPQQAVGERRVAAGEVWLLSAHLHSFDSRYFGPISSGQILGTMTPLITASGLDATALTSQVRRAHSGSCDARCMGYRSPARRQRSAMCQGDTIWPLGGHIRCHTIPPQGN